MKKYLQTFRGNEDHIRLRRWGFLILTTLFALLVAMFNVSNNTFKDTIFDNEIVLFLNAFSTGFILTLICDLLFGVARPSPLFKVKSNDIISYYKLPRIQDALTQEQIGKANEFYNNHIEHVQRIMKETNVAMDVSGSDKNDPRLWKPGHWLWFFNWNK